MLTVKTLGNSFIPVLMIWITGTLCPAHAQLLDHKQGEMIVLLNSDEDIHSLIYQINQAFPEADCRLIRGLNPNMNLWQLAYDEINVSWNVMERWLNQNPGVAIAQQNGWVRLRQTSPDDPLYGNQWQYRNIGASGGRAGADLDAEKAWELSTGGLTASGDTIVLCIIDDGIKLEHPDIIANLWKNHAEIPGNGIDDDGNGYMDDYDGWNAEKNNADVTDAGLGGFHGTPVAGIAGAVGNNSFGVSGVNWNIKLMIVVGGSGTEADILAAYSYPLNMRKKYNQTQGREGAFVVGTNSSWGEDFGRPEQSPLWCAMYDSLGAAGILNAVATSNGDTNVDLFGDMPSTCGSDYIIAVTNLDRRDEKVREAGYGPVHIDIAAYGEDAYTLSAFRTGFGAFGGTSGASPHVAGAIALLYSHPCSALPYLAKTNPPLAAEICKNYILDGAEPLSGFDQWVLTGGKLNLWTSMTQSQIGHVDILGPEEVQFSWDDQSRNHDLVLTHISSGSKTTINDAQSPYRITDLIPCTEYSISIKGYCSQAVRPNYFKTEGCCDAPSPIKITPWRTHADLTWDEVLAAKSYHFELRKSGSQTWESIEIPARTNPIHFRLISLAECTSYEVRISSDCDTSISENQEIYSFKTLGCGSCTDHQYCISQGSTEDEWIQSVSIGGEMVETGDNEGYYQHDGLFPLELNPGSNYSLELVPGYSAGEFEERFSLWIDWNQNGLFDPIEKLFGSPSSKAGPVNGSFTLPASASPGITKMRVTMNFSGDGSAPAPACAPAIPFGEVEDYCISITNCEAVDLLLVNTSETEFQFLIDQGHNDSNVEIRIREKEEDEWSYYEFIDTSTALIQNLKKCTSYELQHRSICMGEKGNWSEISVEKTKGCQSSTTGEKPQDWLVYPNPISDQVFVRGIDFSAWELRNLNGQIISSREQAALTAPEVDSVIKLEYQPSPGLYLLSFKDDKGSLIRSVKIIVQ